MDFVHLTSEEAYREFFIRASQGVALFMFIVSVAVIAFYVLHLRLFPDSSDSGDSGVFTGLFPGFGDIRRSLSRTFVYGPFSALFWACAVGLVLRLVQMNDVLWLDEAYTYNLARLPLDKMLSVVMSDVHPPTNYLVTWLVIRVFGASEWALRLPAFLAGVALIPLCFKLSLALGFSKRVALLSAWLLAVMPAAIKYANEARQYSLLACLVFVFVIALLRRDKLLFLCAGVLVAWTHNLGYFYIAVLGLVALWYNRSWRSWVLLMWAVAALWLPALFRQSLEVSDGFWLVFSWSGLFHPLVSMTISESFPLGLAWLVVTPWVAVLVMTIFISWRWFLTRRGIVWLALFAGVPLSVAVASSLWHPIYLHRALLPAMLATVPLLAKFLHETHRLRFLWRWSAFLAILVALVGFFSPDAGNTLEGRDMAELCAGADAVYHLSVATRFIGEYYLAGTPQYIAPHAVSVDQGFAVAPWALDQMGFNTADDPLALGSDVCAIVTDSPFSNGAGYLSRFLQPGSFSMKEMVYNNYYWIYYYRILTG